MKYSIKQNVRFHIIIFVFLLILSLSSLFILTTSKPRHQPQSRYIRQVEGILILKEGETAALSDETSAVRLIQATESFPGCADCMETARIEITNGSESRMVDFRFGGIAGFHEDTASVFDYYLKIRDLTEDSTIIEYRKQSAEGPAS